MRPDAFAGMSYVGLSAIEWVSLTSPFLKDQYTSLSWYLPFVRFRNLNIITFLAAGMLLGSQKPAGAPPSSGNGAAPIGTVKPASPEPAVAASSPGAWLPLSPADVDDPASSAAGIVD